LLPFGFAEAQGSKGDCVSEQPKPEKHFSQRTTNLLIGASIVILVAALLIRYLTTAPQEGVLALMGIGVFLFLLVAFDQPN
jgi:hypothetical protein